MDTSKIIRGVVNARGYTVTKAITQWDYGYVFLPEIEDLPATYRLDFSNDEHHGTALPVYGNSEGAEVPEELIDTGKDIFVWYYFIGDGYGKSAYKWRIPNDCKPKTAEDEPTPSQQSSIDQLISVANEAVDSAQESASEASASAQSAKEDADRAEEARDDASTFAQRSANSAQASADYSESAQASATASAQSASEAQSASTNAETYALNSGNKAVESAQSAQASANSATQAQGFANNASASAQSASTSASNASTSAQTASAKALDASQSASTASQKAAESAQSASQALSYKTDAESAKTASQTAQGLAESARDSAISAKNDAEQAKADAESARDEAVQAVASISGALDNKADVITDTASGAVASFSDGADGLPLKSLVVNIDPVQEGTGDPSPENICPISGWDTVTLRQCNANLWNDDFYKIGNIMTKIENPESDFDGFYSGSVASWHDAQVPVMSKLLTKGVDKITMSAMAGNLSTTNTFNFRFTIMQANGTDRYDGNLPVTVSNRIKKISRHFTASAGTKITGFFVDTNAGTGNRNGVIKDVMVSLDGSTDYVAPQSTVLPISLGQIVYGGKLDVLTGKLTVYPYYASYNGEALTGEWISDRDVYAVGTTPTIGAQVVNIGADGTEYQLEPHEVASLLGANNIFADTGDTACEYRADTKLYISRLTEPDADMIADSNIVSGQYFMVGNNLYKATANIASGAPVIVGTNCIRKSLSEALNEINA